MVIASNRIRVGAAAVLVVSVLAVAMPAGAQWRGEVWLGTAWSLPSGLTLAQANQPAISSDGSWSTQPYAPAWVYAVRVSRWSGDAAWAFEFMHHKMYLDNPPPGVAYLRLTNGVGFVLAERIWRSHGWEYGVGAGPVLGVPISRVRDLVYNNAHGFFHSQYELMGPGVQLNLGRRLRLLPFTYGMLAVKATAAHLHVHISDGHGTTSNLALHIQYGLSLQSSRR